MKKLIDVDDAMLKALEAGAVRENRTVKNLMETILLAWCRDNPAGRKKKR